MDNKTLQRLEYNKIIEKLVNETLTPVGRDRAVGLMPSTDINEITARQEETSEAREIYRLESQMPLEEFDDLEKFFAKAEKGGLLEPLEILSVARMAAAARRLKKYLIDKKEKYPRLASHAGRLSTFSQFEEEVKKCILPGGEVADDATIDLRNIRSQIRNIQESIKKYLDNIVRSPEGQKILQEAIVTMRGDRYVVPLKQEYRGQFPGIIHDQSASGATLFVEPMAIVEKNNDIRRLKVLEEKEIEKVLTRLTGHITSNIENFRETYETLGEIDFILARGKLSRRMDAGQPSFEEGYLNLIRARHPLLEDRAVPIDVRLGKEFDFLVVTGPNTGGKTVALKTVGLLVLMAQSGLHIPAEPGSKVAVFKKVFADIGDEQSIEQSLSTFSSHMTNIIDIIKNVNQDSLVLLDELGAGTDPAEGAALAMAILEYLLEAKAKGIATTHYSELKTFAFSRTRVENASVEFDTRTLRPTYKLIIGQPGHSSAFEIAGRLGLPQDIVGKAKGYLTREDIEVAELIRSLEEKRIALEKERAEAEILTRELQTSRDEYRSRLRELKDKRAHLIEKATEEARTIINKAKREVEEITAELKEKWAKEADKISREELNEARAKIKGLQNALEEPEDEDTGEVLKPDGLKEGLNVYIPSLKQKGTVLQVAEDGSGALVRVGIMKINLPLKDLRKTDREEQEIQKRNIAKVMVSKARDISPELDVRGLTVDEAIYMIDKYLDDASLAGLLRVDIIHGKGTGALRSAIQEALKGHRHVDSFRLGVHGEGGSGVTVVNLK